MNLKSLAIAAVAVSTLTNQAQARDAIQIAGSSTVFSFAAVVAEQFHNSHPQFPASIVASGGTTGGLTLFCQGIGDHTIDIVNASRLIRPAEIQACHERGVTDIIEVRIGYDGIVFASHTSGPDFSLTPRSLWLAIAARVPVNNQLVPNPNTNWRQISPSLPNQEIQLFIPGENHGTREVFEERVLDAGCEAVPEIQALSTANDVRTHACRAVRRDSRVVDITGDYTETLARIQSSPHAVGVFGLSFSDQNRDRIQVATLNGIIPTVETVVSGQYPVSRPLFFYIKKAHLQIVPGLRDYVLYFLSDDMIGPEGLVTERGLIPMPSAERAQQRENFKAGRILTIK